MALTRKRQAAILFAGDVLLFVFALWLTLVLRHGQLPDAALFYNHLIPFTLLFIVWVLVYFIAGLYDRSTVLFQHHIPNTVVNAQLTNVAIAALFFFFIPYFGITPKTNLVIYLVVSSTLIVLWRLYIFPLLGLRRRQQAIAIGSGKEMQELVEEVNNNPHYHFEFALTIDARKVVNPNDMQKQVLEYVGIGHASIIVCNTNSEDVESLLPLLYNLTFLNTSAHFIDIARVYEDVFERVPLTMLRYDWFLHNISTAPKVAYGFLKRLMDIMLASAVGVVSLFLCPFVWAAIKLEDGGSLFVVQERIGQNNKPIRILKFRSMTGSDKGRRVLKSTQEVTRVGRVLRKTRIDEFPQLWSVVLGRQSLIGPRPELPELAKYYAERIPYYNARHLIKPGISGWGQIHDYDVPRKGADVERTKRKLSYDLYYVKHRSFLLDLHIALKTVKTLLSRSGT